MVSEEAAEAFPAEDLLQPFRTRGPTVHVAAVRALARATGRRAQIKRATLPNDGSFETLVRSGLIDERGRLTADGVRVAQIMVEAPARVRLHAAGAKVPLIFEAHVFDGRALIVATVSPIQLQTGELAIGQESTDRLLGEASFLSGFATREPQSRVGLDIDSLSRLPVAMATWAGLRHSAMIPEQRTYTVSWKKVQARFADASGRSSEPGEDDDDDAFTPPDGVTEAGQEQVARLWSQPWSGWALSTQPSTSTMTVVQVGENYYRLSRPAWETAQLDWMAASDVWDRLVKILRGVVPA